MWNCGSKSSAHFKICSCTLLKLPSRNLSTIYLYKGYGFTFTVPLFARKLAANVEQRVWRVFPTGSNSYVISFKA